MLSLVRSMLHVRVECRTLSPMNLIACDVLYAMWTTFSTQVAFSSNRARGHAADIVDYLSTALTRL